MRNFSNQHYWHLLLLSVIALVIGQASTAQAKTFTVNSTADVVDQSPGDGKCETGRDASGTAECTLRAAIQEANALAGKDEIIIPAGTYVLSQPTQCTYRVKGNPNFLTYPAISLCVTTQVAISGTGASTTIIDGGNLDRVFFVSADAEAEICGVTIQNGAQPYGGSFIGGGAGINNQGTLTLSETVFNGNKAEFGTGGCIHNAGTLTVNKSTFIGNTTNNEGGGIYNYYGEMAVTDSLFSGNTAGNNGGGISSYYGTVTVAGSTFNGNTAGGIGGGIVIFHGTLTLTNSTLSGNSAWVGAGLGNDAPVKLNNVTITRNRSGNSAGGIWTRGTFTLRNTLIAENTAEVHPEWSDCVVNGPPLTSQGHNLVQNTTFCPIEGDTTGNITGQAPRLGPLLNNGGLTPTHALLADSPAINAGDPSAPGSGGTACAAADQRGLLRPIGSVCDIGAFEHEGGFSAFTVQPNRGGNTASVIAVISGSGFKDGAAVKLTREAQPDIIGTPVTVEAAGSAISTAFDLNGKATGPWDVVVTNSDGTSTTLPGGFIIEQTRLPEVWSQVVGRNAIRPGLPARYTILYGNRGNVDALGVPLTISTPADMQFNIYFRITPPPPQAGQVPTDWSLVPVDVLPSTESGVTNALFFLPVIPAGFTGALRISLTLPPNTQHGDTFTFAAYLGTPIFKPDLDPNSLEAHVSGARAYAQEKLGVTIPLSLVPELRQYATAQFQNAVASDRESLVSSLGTRPEVYSLAQLTIDLARFAAARATSSTTRFKRFGGAAPSWLSLGKAPRAALWSLAATNAARNPCATRVLLEGESCGDPPPTAVPDPKTPKPPIGIPPSDCLKELNHHISSDGKLCVPDNRKGCPIFPNPFVPSSPDCNTYPIRESVDPNDKSGPAGGTDKHFRPSDTPLSYTVLFENQPTASAPAQVVTITDQLDTSKLDLSTFSLGPISFGSYTVTPPPGQSEFVSALDLRPANDLIVKIDARLDKATGVVTWQFTSLDTATQQPTEDPLAGFLPPNVNPPEGDGSVLFTVMPKQGLATGTEIRNKARIVFDVNAPIDTPEWLNTIDNTKPTSSVLPLSSVHCSPAFTVRWSGTDAGSGILDFTVYVSDNGGPFTPWLTRTTDTQATFTGLTGHTYSFFSVARDLAENTEDIKTAAEATTSIGPGCYLQISEFRFRGPNGPNDEFVELYNRSDTPLTVSATDGSSGWSLVACDGAARFTIPNNTVIPARGHYLGVNNNTEGYSLGSHPAGKNTTATPDATYTTGIPDNAGIALYSTSNPANFIPANILDAVGFGSTAAPYFEGIPLPAVGTVSNDEYSVVRKTKVTGGAGAGLPIDFNNNATDFMLVSTTGSIGGTAAMLGAPGPENLSSPIQRNAQIRATLADPMRSPAHPNNRFRNPAPVTNGPLGTLSIRRTYTNNTGQPITRLRFRIVDITTLNSPGYTLCPNPNSCAQADLRALSSGDITLTRADNSTVEVKGLTLEEPPVQSSGGGLNSTLSAGTITTATPLAAGDKITVQFVLGIQQVGNFSFFVNIEALP